MARARNQLERRKQARYIIDGLMKQPGMVLLIHYSCESFYDRRDGSSPRVTSIAVRNLGNKQSSSFSIHRVAEREGISISELPQHYDRLERKMLDEFYDYVRSHSGYSWVHWNMRDANYGFAAIEHRIRVLEGCPVVIPEDRRTDLAALLIDMYGSRYAPHQRLTTLLKINDISSRDFLSGKDEAQAFEEGEYVKLHQSTLRKVDVFENVLDRVWDDTLKTQARWKDRYGTTLGGIVEAVTDHWAYKLLGFLGIIGTLMGVVFALRGR